MTAADNLLDCFDYTIREDEAFTTNGDFENIPGGTNTLIFNAITANGWIASISTPDVVDPAITVGGMSYVTSPTGGNFMHLAAAVTTGSVTGEEIAYNVTGLIIGNTYTVSWDQIISNGNSWKHSHHNQQVFPQLPPEHPPPNWLQRQRPKKKTPAHQGEDLHRSLLTGSYVRKEPI